MFRIRHNYGAGMLRIVGVEKSERAAREFVLLQNQSGLRMSLAGYAVMAGGLVDGETFGEAPDIHVFAEEEQIPGGTFVLLATGFGTPRWALTKDGQRIFHVYMNRERPLWSRREGPVSLLGVQHTYNPRRAQGLVLA